VDILIYILGILAIVMGLFILNAARKYKFREYGLTFPGLSYLIGGIATLVFFKWWPLAAGLLLAFIFRKSFGEPEEEKK